MTETNTKLANDLKAKKQELNACKSTQSNIYNHVVASGSALTSDQKDDQAKQQVAVDNDSIRAIAKLKNAINDMRDNRSSYSSLASELDKHLCRVCRFNGTSSLNDTRIIVDADTFFGQICSLQHSLDAVGGINLRFAKDAIKTIPSKYDLTDKLSKIACQRDIMLASLIIDNIDKIRDKIT